MDPLDVFELNLLDAADVRSLRVIDSRSQAGEKLDLHLPSSARAQAPVEIDVVGGGDPLFAEIDVVGPHEQVVLMVRPLALAADRHRPAQAAFDQPPDAAFIDVQGRVEVQVRAVGHIHHDGVSHPFAQVGFVLVGEENNGHGAEIHPAVIAVDILLPEQHALAVVVDDLGVVELPGALRKKIPQIMTLVSITFPPAPPTRWSGGGSIQGTANSA